MGDYTITKDPTRDDGSAHPDGAVLGLQQGQRRGGGEVAAVTDDIDRRADSLARRSITVLRRPTRPTPMKSFPLKSDRVSLAVTETGGQLSDVAFTLRRRAHGHARCTSRHGPTKHFTDDIPPMLRMLRGDFFCRAVRRKRRASPTKRAFTDCPPTARGGLTGRTGAALDAVLDGTIMGATVDKHVELRPGESVVYQRHTFYRRQRPAAHRPSRDAARRHAAAARLRAMDDRASRRRSRSKRRRTGARCSPTNQTIGDLTQGEAARRRHCRPHDFPDRRRIRGAVDARVRSGAALRLDGRDGGRPEAGCGSRSRTSGRLPQTLLWFSNGGRDYPPWNGRHRRVDRHRGNLRLFSSRPCGFDRRQSGRRSRQPDGGRN